MVVAASKPPATSTKPRADCLQHSLSSSSSSSSSYLLLYVPANPIFTKRFILHRRFSASRNIYILKPSPNSQKQQETQKFRCELLKKLPEENNTVDIYSMIFRAINAREDISGVVFSPTCLLLKGEEIAWNTLLGTPITDPKPR